MADNTPPPPPTVTILRCSCGKQIGKMTTAAPPVSVPAVACFHCAGDRKGKA